MLLFSAGYIGRAGPILSSGRTTVPLRMKPAAASMFICGCVTPGCTLYSLVNVSESISRAASFFSFKVDMRSARGEGYEQKMAKVDPQPSAGRTPKNVDSASL